MPDAKRMFFLGLVFSAITVFFWGMLPIALKLSTGFSDAITLTWVRFLFAAVVILVWQWRQRRLSEFTRLTRSEWFRLLAAGTLLITNYTTFVVSLDYMHPGAAQLSFQLAPLFLALGGFLFLKERIYWQQWACFAFILIGMAIFFHPVVEQSFSGNSALSGSMGVGFIIVQASSMAWTSYALIQKSLFKKLSSSNILLAIYIYASIVMLPFATPSHLQTLSTQDTLIVAFCCLNTLIAYGAFSQAMRYWQTVQVSAAVALTPIAAFILTEICVSIGLWKGIIRSANADLLSLIGIGLVVCSAILVQFISANLANKALKKNQQTEPELTAS
ncbi:DMT family transporter [Marinomonas balearica]|uniref:EamA-like transporter family protein n=1 Tax=Marinomonas balearica TaxID=491947 RepID=A0A4R6M5M6_9GAMM|nr:DMT family transporter [Marinomonas balearica]TDO95860.1 EamA-like transporter family protein [Marinomonas balearica]